MNDASQQLIGDVLENLRRRLLDLTSRNRLLHFRHPKTSCIRIIDEIPDQLKEFLVDNDKEMRFLAVPDPLQEELIEAGFIEVDPETGEETLVREPSAKEWAEWLGLSTTYEVPEASKLGVGERKHTDNAIQTIFFPDDLEARLRGMRQKANLAMEETGANILYLAIGFLEWFEHRDSETKRLAPLYMIPVRLDRGKLNPSTRTYEYRLKCSGEDILTNVSLREKLRNDFSIALPELEDSVEPEEYLKSVADAVKTREPSWAVRRYITLAHLNFSKQLLYLDLDPAKWPSDKRITSHPLVRQCVAGLSDKEGDGGSGCSFGEEHAIDDIDTVHASYPLIDNADSSQHSALIDAIDGKNLVIEGPPGTGKSQTITNLIAAAIANQKKVLFVAEKAAALDVVKRRLDQAELGAFCLELHSHRSQKRRVLDDLAERLKLQRKFREPSEIESEIALYEELKEKLRQHASLVNSKWLKTDLTIHEILSAATRYRNELTIDPVKLHPTGIDGQVYTPLMRKQVLGCAQTFATVVEGVLKELEDADCITDHPWHGVGNAELRNYEQERVVEELSKWQKSLKGVCEAAEKLASVIGIGIADLPDSTDLLAKVSSQIAAIPAPEGDEPLFALPKLRGEHAHTLAKGVQLHKAIQHYFAELTQHLATDCLSDAKAAVTVVDASRWLKSVAADEVSLSELLQVPDTLDTVEGTLDGLREPMERVGSALNLGAGNRLTLSQAGLAELSKIARLAGSLEAEHAVYRHEIFDQDELDDALPRLEADTDALRSQRELLAKTYELQLVPDVDRLRAIESTIRQAGVFRLFDAKWRQAKRELKAARIAKGVRFSELCNHLRRLVEYCERESEFAYSDLYQRVLGHEFQGLSTDVARIKALRAWYRAVRDEFGVGFGGRVPIGNAVIGMSDETARALRSLNKQGLHQEIDKLKAAINRLVVMFPGCADLARASTALDQRPNGLTALRTSFSKHVAQAAAAFKNTHVSVEDIHSIAGRLDKLLTYLESWRKLALCDRYFGNRIDLKVGPGLPPQSVIPKLETVATIAETLAAPGFPEKIAEKVYREPSKSTIDVIRMRNQMVATSLSVESKERSKFKESVKLDLDDWGGDAGPSISGLIDRNAVAISKPQWLSSWLEYLRVREQLQRLGWGGLARELEAAELPPQIIESAVMLGTMDALSRQILSEVRELATFSGLTQQGIQQQFREYDDRIRALQRKLIAWKASRAEVPNGNASGLVRDYTELGLVNKEIGKKMRHIPLRQLVRRASRAISGLKPCFMMSPMSVAQFLEPGLIEFDLVVMDEASQIRPEDAIGAVARGAQLVVVGDPKQLPPTSFFDKILDEEDEEEDFTAGQESESILDAALTTFPARRLRWHYRSQHESLIAFSNHTFYGSDLVIFPSPAANADDYGIQFTRVRRGRFVNRVNREEAELIAKAVREHMLDRPDESIGVAAMSAQQREQIERAIEEESKEDSRFRDSLDSDQLKTEPLFVKNLENVQGDERDVIYLSMTYGPSEVGGKVAQRFGPINTANGWRRLNVLFTRAKKRMHVFSSMGPEDIVITPSSSRGVQALKDFLEYASNGNLPSTLEHTGRGPDSDFEVAVAQLLSGRGYECVPQVGVAGYFLDIAVKDPGNPGRYLMAIECDGATYHSAKSTRDRDRLRQAILEQLGWRVRRIWSTDWFNNPEGQLAPILQELDELKSAPTIRPVEDISEADQVDSYADELTKEEEAVSTFVQEEADLKTRLERFDRDVIRKECPNTPDNKRLLRPAMIEALLEYRPKSLWEFQQEIPPFLRRGTLSGEGKYLKQVLNIVYESETATAESISFG